MRGRDLQDKRAAGQAMNGNGRAIERTILIAGLLLQIVLGAVAYGRLAEKADGLEKRLERIERIFDAGRMTAQ
jgi:hypothetical protein